MEKQNGQLRISLKDMPILRVGRNTSSPIQESGPARNVRLTIGLERNCSVRYVNVSSLLRQEQKKIPARKDTG